MAAEFRRWYDGVRDRDVMEARGLEPTAQFSMRLLEQAVEQTHQPWLVVEGDKITLDLDNGKWVYVVTDVDEAAGMVTARWPD